MVALLFPLDLMRRKLIHKCIKDKSLRVLPHISLLYYLSLIGRANEFIEVYSCHLILKIFQLLHTSSETDNHVYFGIKVIHGIRSGTTRLA